MQNKIVKPRSKLNTARG